MVTHDTEPHKPRFLLPQLSDAPSASDDLARGNLEGDVHLPKAPVRDPVVMDWEDLTEPRLSPTHDSVGRALASFFTREGGWVYLTQDTIAKAARLSRQTTCGALKDLEKVGRFQRQDMTTRDGNRGDAYRLYGEMVDWKPTDLGNPERTTAKEFEKDKQIHQLEDRVLELEGLVRDLASRLPADGDLPDSALLLLQGRSTISSRREASEYYSGIDSIPDDNSTLSSKLLDSGLEAAAQERGDWITETQLVSLFIHQERTDLSDDDIRAKWEEVDRGTLPPQFLKPGFLTKSQAWRLVRWIGQQPDAPVPGVPESTMDEACTCSVVYEEPEEEPPTDGEASAREVWRAVLGELELQLPRPTFEIWLKPTVGVAYDEAHFLVQVATPYTIAWLERRMYHSMQRVVEQVTGHPLELQFQVPPGATDCPAHGLQGR